MARSTDPAERVYITATHPAGGLLIGLVFGGLIILTAAFEYPNIGAVIYDLVFFVFTIAFAYRFARARGVASPEGLHVINLMTVFDLSWDEIDRFEIGRWKILPAVCLIRLQNGETSHIYGIEENYFFPGESGRKLVEELNAELSEYRSAGAAPEQAITGAQDELFRAPRPGA